MIKIQAWPVTSNSALCIRIVYGMYWQVLGNAELYILYEGYYTFHIDIAM